MGRLKKNDVEGRELVEKRMRICKKLGITYSAYMHRLRKGWTEDEAAVCPKVAKAVWYYKGQTAYSYVKEHGGSVNLFYRYIDIYPLEEAIDRAINKRGQVKYYRDGITLRQWCIKNGKRYDVEYKKLWTINHLDE